MESFKMKAIDLTQPWGIQTAPWPGGVSPQIKYVNRISYETYLARRQVHKQAF